MFEIWEEEVCVILYRSEVGESILQSTVSSDNMLLDFHWCFNPFWPNCSVILSLFRKHDVAKQLGACVDISMDHFTAFRYAFHYFNRNIPFRDADTTKCPRRQPQWGTM